MRYISLLGKNNGCCRDKPKSSLHLVLWAKGRKVTNLTSSYSSLDANQLRNRKDCGSIDNQYEGIISHVENCDVGGELASRAGGRSRTSLMVFSANVWGGGRTRGPCLWDVTRASEHTVVSIS
jgi:hypothetical protein